MNTDCAFIGLLNDRVSTVLTGYHHVWDVGRVEVQVLLVRLKWVQWCILVHLVRSIHQVHLESCWRWSLSLVLCFVSSWRILVALVVRWCVNVLLLHQVLISFGFQVPLVVVTCELRLMLVLAPGDRHCDLTRDHSCTPWKAGHRVSYFVPTRHLVTQSWFGWLSAHSHLVVIVFHIFSIYEFSWRSKYVVRQFGSTWGYLSLDLTVRHHVRILMPFSRQRQCGWICSVFLTLLSLVILKNLIAGLFALA